MSVAHLVLRRVLDHPLPEVVLRDRKHGDRLEAPPSHREDEGIAILEDLWVPSVLLQADPDEAHLVLAGPESAQDERVSGVEVLDELAGHGLDLDADVHAGSESLVLHADGVIHSLEF